MILLGGHHGCEALRQPKAGSGHKYVWSTLVVNKYICRNAQAVVHAKTLKLLQMMNTTNAIAL